MARTKVQVRQAAKRAASSSSNRGGLRSKKSKKDDEEITIDSGRAALIDELEKGIKNQSSLNLTLQQAFGMVKAIIKVNR